MTASPMIVTKVSGAESFEAFGILVTQYVEWCRARYQEDAWFVDQALGHQALDEELAQLSVKYSPPHGWAFLAHGNGEICEMKRVFVPERFRGNGVGRALCNEIVRSARREGYRIMRLDTADRLVEAIAMYEAIGFKRRLPYQSYPDRLMPYLVFMEMPLAVDLTANP
jgi:GNAT superfamily N-acetyltransferase